MLLEDGRAINATGADLSEAGIGAHVDEAVAIGTIATLLIQSQEGKQLRIKARVVSELNGRYGLRFEPEAPEDLHAISALIKFLVPTLAGG